ncbi:C40 family peptidase [Magnetospirillum molischianum]|uniref:C40 family peptidase n=1 Tax=Magnetospirillum molischianum TaxID=1083 RepID=UPI00138AEEB8|nr:NlpC/P60 family protein [Magnetospirillum molischianum]
MIGIAFRYGGRGPEDYDCWGLLMELCRRDNKVIPDFRSTSNIAKIARIMATNRHQWRQIELRPGCGLWFRVRGFASHVGYYLGNDKFVHTWEESGGVVVERLSQWEHRLIGAFEYVGDEADPAALRPGEP